MFGHPGFGRALGATGILVGVVATVATIAGMPMNIHGFGAIVLGHGVWLVWTGAKLMGRQ